MDEKFRPRKLLRITLLCPVAGSTTTSWLGWTRSPSSQTFRRYQLVAQSLHKNVAVHTNDLLPFTAVRRGSYRIERRTTVGFVEMLISDRFELVVVVDVNRRDVDMVIQFA